MADFYLFTNEQALVDCLDDFELEYDIVESHSKLSSLPKRSILIIDLVLSNYEFDSVLDYVSPDILTVVLVRSDSKKELKELINFNNKIANYLTYPPEKEEILDLLEDLKAFKDLKAKLKNQNSQKEDKVDLVFSLNGEDHIDSRPEQGNEKVQKTSIVVSEPDDNSKKTQQDFAKKLGEFNFFEQKDFSLMNESNFKIQSRFEIVFGNIEDKSLNSIFIKNNTIQKIKDDDKLNLNNFSLDDEEKSENSMTNKKDSGLEFSLPKIDFSDLGDPPSQTKPTKESSINSKPVAVDNESSDLEFGGLKEDEDGSDNTHMTVTETKQTEPQEFLGFDLEESDYSSGKEKSFTSKTLVMDDVRSQLNASIASDKKNEEESSSEKFDFDSFDDLGKVDNAKENEQSNPLSALSDDEDDFLSDKKEESYDQTIPEKGIDFKLDNAANDLEIGNEDSSKTLIVEQKFKDNALDFKVTDEEFEIEMPKTKKAPEVEVHKKSDEKKIEASNPGHASGDLISTSEARANIESTINDIIRPDFSDSTGAFNLDDELKNSVNEGQSNSFNLSDDFGEFGDEATMVATNNLLQTDAEDEEFLSGLKEADAKANLSDLKILNHDKSGSMPDISFETGIRGQELFKAMHDTRTRIHTNNQEENSFEEVDFSEEDEGKTLVFKNFDHQEFRPNKKMEMDEATKVVKVEDLAQSHRRNEQPEFYAKDEDFVRAQATIRQLREEREEMLLELKKLKSENKELEQENLSLRAQNDELKIEQTILRKRNLAELEEVKYQQNIAEERRLTAEEKLKASEKLREKLEQKLRLDFTQVRQREKELESQLELMSIDHDAQIQNRDSKILELRRKIESLEFNMENVSIREQKSNEDKKKIEEKLLKIMKTLRHSIENMDDDERSMLNSDDE